MNAIKKKFEKKKKMIPRAISKMTHLITLPVSNPFLDSLNF